MQHDVTDRDAFMAVALTQARLVQTALLSAHNLAEAERDTLFPIIAVKTSGDKIQDRPLAELGGKGLFVKEIEEALLQDDADIAVHSMKDMPGISPKGLFIGAVLEREDPRDVFVAGDGATFTDARAALASLRQGARLGTSSVRRQALAKRLRPDIEIVSLRGNVETRLAKLARGEADATILARAGLTRLGLQPMGATALDENAWPSAPCQGAIGIELRCGDGKAATLTAKISHHDSAITVACERGFLAALDGSCRTPIAGLARCASNKLSFTGEVLTPDGRHSWKVTRDLNGDVNLSTAEQLGREAAQDIKGRAGDRLPKF